MACAVLVKAQHGVFLPPVLAATAIGGFAPWQRVRFDWRRLCIASVSLIGLLAVSPLLLGLPWSDTLERVVAWGVTSDYPTTGPKGLFIALTTGSGASRVVLVWVAVGALLCWRAPTPANIVLLVGLVLSILPLAIRDYGHYVQLSAVWVALITASAAREFSIGTSDRAAIERLFAAVVAVPLLPVWIATAPVSYREWSTRALENQQQAARQVALEVAASDLSDAEKEEIRSRHQEASARVLKAARSAAADGEVTFEEAREMHKHMRQGAKNGKRGKRGKNGKRGKRGNR